MARIIVQIYEVQHPSEAEILVEAGVDHIGSVIVAEAFWQLPQVRATMDVVRRSPAKSCLIPLFNRPDTVLRTLEYYQPDIVHFCDALSGGRSRTQDRECLVRLQENVKKCRPGIKIMRSIPIAPPGFADRVPSLEWGRLFEPVSDYFLTDTLLVEKTSRQQDRQPVEGFVGITGRVCDWDMARQLVKACRIPVILAGGISPDNVRQGLQRVQPAGVDSCTQTNVRDAGGRPVRFKKDIKRVRQLVQAVRQWEAETRTAAADSKIPNASGCD